MRVLWYPKRWREILTDREVMFITSNRMRVFNFHSALQGLPGFHSDVVGYTVRDPNPFDYDVVVFQKVLNRRLAFALKQTGVVTVLDACDPLRLPGGLSWCLDMLVSSNHELAQAFERDRLGIEIDVVEDAHEADPHRVKVHTAGSRLRATTYGTQRTVEESVGTLAPILNALPWLEFQTAAGKTSTRPDVEFHLDWRTAWSHPDSWQRFVFDSDVGLVPEKGGGRPRSCHKVLNYMACGIPVICDASDAHRRVVVHGVNGFFADTPDEWVRTLEMLRDPDLRNRIGAEGRRTATEPYSVPVMGAKYASLMTRIQAKRLRGTAGPWRPLQGVARHGARALYGSRRASKP